MHKTYVPGSGNLQPKLVGVGEQPGWNEARVGKVFIGPAGKGLDSCLMLAKIPRHSIYLTNVIKDLDAPLKHYINFGTRGKYRISDDGWQYIKELGEELRKLSPNVVVAFGNVSLLALTNRIGITKWRGSVLDSTLIPGLKVIPTFHPATFIPPKFNFLNKPLIVEDLIKADNESTSKELTRKSRRITVEPSFETSVAVLNHCFEVGVRGQTIAVDIEVINRELDCISFGWSGVDSISIPFRYSQGDYFTPDEEYEIMLLIAKIIQEERIAKGGANFIFDTQFLYHKYGIIPRGVLHCTQIAQKISYPDFPAGLDFVTTMHTDIPYYKQDGKQWMKMGTGTWEEWWNYNGMDSIVPVEALPKQLEVLKKQGNLATYERQRKLIKPLIYMAERGIRVDVAGMIKNKETEGAKLELLAEKLNDEVGYEINYNSPQQLMDYFYKDLNIKPYKKKNSKGQWSETSDVDALKRIARRGYKAAQIMLEIRGLSKRISTYMNIGKVDTDGRYRSSYKPVGAETGRLSSGETIFGTGGNQQNWPHDLLRFFLFDEGYIGYSFDLSQIENRIVAYVGGVISQIEAFETGKDLHRLSASVVFSKPYDEISDKDNSSTLGNGTQSERFWGKKCKFDDCEVLTPSGWISIAKAYIDNLPIATWDTDRNITFEVPTDWYTDTYSGPANIISNQRIYQKATPEHKMPLLYNGKVVNKKISEYPSSGKYSAPLSGTYSGTFHIPTYLMQLLAAFQADGFWNASYGIGFKLKKQRKIDRLKHLLKLSNIPYTNGNTIYISSKEGFCQLAKLLIGKSKTFGSWLLSLDQKSLKALIDEVPHWDGYIEGAKRYYFTTNKENAEWIQTISHLCGKASLIHYQDNSSTDAYGDKMLYRVNIRHTVAPATHAITKSTIQVKHQIIYCPTVNSGYFLCKEHEIVSITGNSNHAINYDIGYKAFALVNDMQETEAKHIIEKIHRGYPQIRNGYHATVQNMLKANRTVTNLFGRTRLFLGPIIPSYPDTPTNACQNTYRQAYAHLPQSTTADKINEQGVEYIYYNQNLFAPVEILTQVHDSVVFQIPKSIPFKAHAEMLLLIKRSLETPLHWHQMEIKTPTDLSIGFNMSKKEMIELKSKNIPDDATSFGNKLKEIHDDLLRRQRT